MSPFTFIISLLLKISFWLLTTHQCYQNVSFTFIMSPFTFIISLLLCISFWLLTSKFLHRRRRLPPSSRPLPIIGSLHLLGALPHRALRTLSQKYGPIMYLRLGYRPTIIVSSPECAELFLKTHDTVFASRPRIQASDYFSYGTKGMVFTEYGPYWCNVRKFCTLELLSATKIGSFAGMRREEIMLMVKTVEAAAVAGEVMDVSDVVGGVMENTLQEKWDNVKAKSFSNSSVSLTRFIVKKIFLHSIPDIRWHRNIYHSLK